MCGLQWRRGVGSVVLLVLLSAGHPGGTDAAPCPQCSAFASLPVWDRPEGQQSPSANATATPALLQRIFIAVSFAWNLQKVVHLEHMLNIFIAYPTHLAITVVSNEPAKLRTLLWGLGIRGVQVWDGFNSSRYHHHKYGLLYEHRFAMENASTTGRYSSYIYAEDDTRISWPALVSWALDTQVLEPLGYLRNFYRTEHNTSNAVLMLTDIANRNDLSHRHLVRVVLPPGVPPCSSMARLEHAEHCAHEHYFKPHEMYQGMWVATHALLQRFMASPYWTVEGAQATRWDSLGYRYAERSTGMIQVVDPLKDQVPAVLLPYYPEGGPGGAPGLPAVAAIGHTRNGYAGDPGTVFGKLAVDHALFFSKPPAHTP